MIIAAVVIAIVAGCGFYALRCRKPFWYGLIEVLVALLTVVWPAGRQ
jgi:hypothetical protein